VPVVHPDLRARLQHIIEVNMADDVLAWELSGDGGLAEGAHDPGDQRAAGIPG